MSNETNEEPLGDGPSETNEDGVLDQTLPDEHAAGESISENVEDDGHELPKPTYIKGSDGVSMLRKSVLGVAFLAGAGVVGGAGLAWASTTHHLGGDTATVADPAPTSRVTVTATPSVPAHMDPTSSSPVPSSSSNSSSSKNASPSSSGTGPSVSSSASSTALNPSHAAPSASVPSSSGSASRTAAPAAPATPVPSSTHEAPRPSTHAPVPPVPHGPVAGVGTGDRDWRRHVVTLRSGRSSYLIQPGDTLSQLAEWMRTSVADLARANGIADVDRIYAGRSLVLPMGVRVHG